MKTIAFLFLSTISFAQSITKTINLLPDTGQTTSYTTTFGEDHDYTINTLSYSNNGNGTITDNVTGLMWQQSDGGEMIYENAAPYCEALNYAGYTDWRLPSPIEGFSIMNLQNNNPAINTTYFTTSTAEYWWTNTIQVGDNTKVWCTNAGGGIGNKPKAETISAGGTFKYHTRCVRNIVTPSILPNHFTDNGNGTITDNLTQLVWQKIPSTTTSTWEQALTYAEGLNLAGNTDWRLPNIKELQSLNDENITNPAVNLTYFSALGVHNYWSSTTLKPNTANPSSAWCWNTQLGITTYDLKSNSNYVLCVRGLPALNSSEFTTENKLSIFPNPFHFKINLKTYTGNENFELYSNIGQLIFKGKSIENEDFSSLPNGIYFLNVIDKISTTIKLVKD